MKRLTKVRFSNLDKVLYPALEITKKDVIEYYIRVSPRMLKFLKGRALVRTRYPDGVNAKAFYEKDAPAGIPDWVRTHAQYSPSSDKTTQYVVCDDLDTLIWLANLAALELHIPLSRIANAGKPDLALFDVDPEPPAGQSEAVQVAELVREILDSLGLRSYVKTSGQKGIHVVIPLEPVQTFEQTREFVHAIGSQLAKESELVVSERSQTKNPGTVLIDYPQNSERAAMIAPYSLRPTQEATVSTPLDWAELQSLRPFDWNIFNVADRMKNPWKDIWDNPQRIKIR